MHLCSLSNFDAYQVTRIHRAPKPFAFAIKSTDNLSFFENTADYLHSFACSEKDGKVWMEKILVARVRHFCSSLKNFPWSEFYSFFFVLFSLMFFSKNDISYSTLRLSTVMPVVSLVLGLGKRQFKDPPIPTFSNLVLFFQNNYRQKKKKHLFFFFFRFSFSLLTSFELMNFF